MRRRKVKNVAASIRQRLLNEARLSDRPFNELLQYFAMERFLYRLSESPHGERFVLKGALMLATWEGSLTRPTKDIDLLGHLANDVEGQFDFEGGILAAALRETFARRDSEVVARPVALTKDFAEDTAKASQWQGFLRKSRLEGAPNELVAVVEAIAVFLGPVAKALHEGRGFEGRWRSPGPWSQALHSSTAPTSQTSSERGGSSSGPVSEPS